jgi:flavin-binding protein dodecin
MSDVAEHKKEEKRGKIVLANVSKVIELQAESTKSWEDAVQLCLAEAVRTIRNVTTISVSEFTAAVKDDAVQRYQVRCKVAFSIDDAMRSH